MKSKITLLTSIGLGLASLAQAQLPVSTTAQNKKVVLEEFTGIYCGWCPDGHKLANNLKASKPKGDVIVINVHTGGYAQPGPSDPDYRTSEGAVISNITGMNITGYPTGSINRHLFSGQTGFAVSRSAWSSMATQILGQTSYANIALEGNINEATRELSVTVEVYYTGDAPGDNKLTVALLEDSLIGPQSGAASLYPAMVTPEGKYIHMHMLKKVLTADALGDVILQTEATTGSKITKTYTYTIPEKFVNVPTVLKNLSLVAYVSEGDNSDIMTGAEGPITIGGTSIQNVLNDNSVKVYPNPASDNVTVSVETGVAGKVSLEVFDIMGRSVLNMQDNVQVGQKEFKLDISALNAGIYNLNVRTAEGVITKKMTVTK